MHYCSKSTVKKGNFHHLQITVLTEHQLSIYNLLKNPFKIVSFALTLVIN